MTSALRRHSRMTVDVLSLAERPADADFADLAFKMVGDLSGWTVLHEDVLVITWVSRRITAGGIIRTELSVDEDRWQGTIGLVAKLGANAFKIGQWGLPYTGPVPKVGEYVTFHPSSTTETSINGISCKYIPASLIKAIITEPTRIY